MNPNHSPSLRTGNTTAIRRAARAAACFTLLVSACGGSSDAASGCEPFQAFAQNRWDPIGAALRAAPKKDAVQVGSIKPNEPVMMEEWMHTGIKSYPDNPAPFDGEIWFKIAGQNWYVNAGAVRAERTEHDASGVADGGMPAATPEDCETTPPK